MLLWLEGTWLRVVLGGICEGEVGVRVGWVGVGMCVALELKFESGRNWVGAWHTHVFLGLLVALLTFLP